MVDGLFVTGTDTGVGKTVVAAALMHRYRELATLKYWKPIQTGIEDSDDTAAVRQLGACDESELCTSGVRLTRPLSPHLSARLAGTRIEIAELIARVETDKASVRWIVEGAGGVLVPINESELMTDLIVRLQMPVVIATRCSLGTINHTLLTIEALQRRNLEIAGVVMVGDKNKPNRAAIEDFGGVKVIGEMPHFASLTAKSLCEWAASNLDAEGLLRRYLI